MFDLSPPFGHTKTSSQRWASSNAARISSFGFYAEPVPEGTRFNPEAALGHYCGECGEPRATADVDLVVGIGVDRCKELLEQLDSTPFRPLFSDASEVV